MPNGGKSKSKTQLSEKSLGNFITTLQKSGKIKVTESYLPSALASCSSQGSWSAWKNWSFILSSNNLFLGKAQKERFWGTGVAWRRHAGSAGNTLWLQADAWGNWRVAETGWCNISDSEANPLLSMFMAAAWSCCSHGRQNSNLWAGLFLISPSWDLTTS